MAIRKHRWRRVAGRALFVSAAGSHASFSRGRAVLQLLNGSVESFALQSRSGGIHPCNIMSVMGRRVRWPILKVRQVWVFARSARQVGSTGVKMPTARYRAEFRGIYTWPGENQEPLAQRR